ncbi:tyrosine-type recombinase/integrase [Kaistia nematophila]|uniref:Tyrosine-type recombinase/integrase n=1 Tax=Kaistia nematophila TaxID=2994654 RepID=A0A9X3IM66_9HYPH|nr:tyrosine-type recombinase/integrase [Kaistia nematophila]MCX5571444.1 tyrosine-type recombinase/integrase [Kaistia nematophila]
MKRPLPKYVYRHRDRYGTERLYYRPPNGGSTRLPDDPQSEAFAEAHRRLAEGAEHRPATKSFAPPPPQNTLESIWRQYERSREFRALEKSTQRVRQLVIEKCLKEPIRPDASETFGDCPVNMLTAKAIKVLRDRKADFPNAANGRLKAIRQMLSWAIEAEVDDDLTYNIARDVRNLKVMGDGFHSWTLDEVEQFERTHPLGSRARLAFALLLYTGQRRSDMVTFGRQHVRDGWLFFTQFKGRKRNPIRMQIPIVPELQKVIDASPCGDLTFLMTDYGKPFTSNGFGNKMRQWCDEARLPDCSAHGLRKAAASRLAELGCTDAEIMAITGHTTRKEVDRYTKGARQRALAENVLRRVEQASE